MYLSRHFRWLNLLSGLLFLGTVARAQTAPENRLLGQTREEFAARRAQVRAAAPGSIVLVGAGAQDEETERVRFRAENAFVYLTGVEVANGWLALLPEDDPSGLREILFLPPIPPGASRWVDLSFGPGSETERATGIAAVRPLPQMWETLTPSLQKAKTVFLAGRSETTATERTRLRELNPALKIEGGAERFLAPLRVKKSPGEIANLRASIAATALAQQNAVQAIRAGKTELAIEGVVLAGFRAGGATREAFPCVIGGGPNSVVLHHYAGPRAMRAGETVVVDIGAEFDYYAADITRTYPVGGKFTPRQRQIYQLVLDTQRACAAQVRPGKTTPRDLNRFAREFMRKSPLRAKDESGKEQTMERFFLHGLGHQLGMDVHDVYDLGNKPYEPGMVFTIEPGLYIASEGIGIRIEDDYLVTEAGVEKLSRTIPSEVAAIEALMRPAAPPKPTKTLQPRRRIHH